MTTGRWNSGGGRKVHALSYAKADRMGINPNSSLSISGSSPAVDVVYEASTLCNIAL